MSDATDRAVSELYQTAPEDFIERRDALVRRLKDEGRDVDAVSVKRLRKPTVAAWALNRLSAEAPDAIADLIASGEALTEAQWGVMGGGSPTALHEATTRRRTVVAELTARAGAILREAGRASDTHTEDIQGMLEAASVEPEHGERLRTGTIERTVRPSSGFGLGLSLVDAGEVEPGDEVQPAATRADRAAALDAEIASLTTTRKGQDRALAKAERARDRTAAAVETARERLETAKAALRDAEADLSAAQLEAKRARRALERAEKERARLR